MPNDCTDTVAPSVAISTAARALRPGDVLCLRGGTYRQQVTLNASGTQSAPVVISSYPGERAVIDGSSLSLGSTSDLVAVTGSYVTLSDIEVQNSSGRSVSLAGTGSRITGSRVHDAQYNGILAAGTNQTIDNNEVWNTVLSNTDGRLGSSGWAEAINTWHAANTTIRGNYVHDNWGEGVDFIGSNGGLVTDNAIIDNYSVLVYVDGSSNVTISDNELATTTDKYDRESGPPYGVLIANESGGGSVANIAIANNTFVRTSGINTWDVTVTGLVTSDNSFTP